MYVNVITRATGRLLFEATVPTFLKRYDRELPALPSQMAVAGFSAHTDVGRAHETANEVKRLAKQLKEAQAAAQTYNGRERLFGKPITNVSRPEKYTTRNLNANMSLCVLADPIVVLLAPWVDWDGKWEGSLYPRLVCEFDIFRIRRISFLALAFTNKECAFVKLVHNIEH